MRFRCSHCGRVLTVEDGLAGRRARCPACGEVMSIPAHGEPPPPGPAEPAPGRPADQPPAPDAAEGEPAGDAQAGEEQPPAGTAAEGEPAGDAPARPAGGASAVGRWAARLGRFRWVRYRARRRVLLHGAMAVAAVAVVAAGVVLWLVLTSGSPEEKAAMGEAEQALRTAYREDCERVVGKPFSVEVGDVTFGLPSGDTGAAPTQDAARVVVVACEVSGPNGTARADVYMMPRSADPDKPSYRTFRVSVTKGE